MADHDELCGECSPHDHYCHCALIARVRADEREQVGRVWAKREDLLLGDIEVARADERAALNGKLLRLYTQNAHAEAVAAKLVEVICEDAETIDGLRGALWDLAHVRGAVDEIVREEVARLRVESMDALTAERDAARAEVAALTRWKSEATAIIEAWERVHALLGKPGFIGESKAEATWVEVRDLLDARNEAYRDRDAARAEVAALSAERQEALAKVTALIDHLATLKRLDDADTAEIDRLKDAVALRAEVAALSAEINRMVGELSSIRMEHEAEVAVLQDALEDVVNQACSESGTDLDSMALSGYAHGMRVLAERGRIIIEREVGRRVIGRWAEADRG